MMRTLVVENETSACEALKKIINDYCPELSIVGTAHSIQEARKQIQDGNPELILLDIELDNESGFDLFHYFPNPTFDVIFTTAHQEYAIQAIKFSCLDYLLKPIDYRELVLAIRKREVSPALQMKQQLETLLHNVSHSNIQKIAIPYSGGYEFINIHDIIMACAEGNSTHIYTTTKQVLSTRSMGDFENLLPVLHFFRSHKSFIVNWNHIDKYIRQNNIIIMKNGLKAELAARRREEFQLLIERSFDNPSK